MVTETYYSKVIKVTHTWHSVIVGINKCKLLKMHRMNNFKDLEFDCTLC
jgi:hypothetical protein